ncbi:MAG: ADP-ribosylation factor-like protein [Planctomycetota bacterium]
MVQINFAQKTVNAKIVYYGPGMSGKTTNLEVVHQRAPQQNRGELTSISTDGDRTLFFDFMPLDLGTVAGMRTAFQIYTVPGQVYYNSTRKLVLQGVDGVVFVADSSASMLEQNLESLRNLEENLAEYGKGLASLPHIVQYNKRDLPDAMPVAELDKHLNAHGAQTFEAVANSGQGVFPTLKALAAAVLKNIMQESQGRPGAKPGEGAPAAAPQAQPQQMQQPAQPMQQQVPQQPQPAPAAPMPAQQGGHNPYGQQQQIAAQHAQQQPAGGAQPMQVQQQVAAQPQQQVQSPASVMQTQAAPRPAKARPAQRAKPTGAKAQRREKELSVPARKSGAMTAAFVLVAAGVGAVIAWALLGGL